MKDIKMKTPKLTTLEKRAKEFIERSGNEFTLTIEWKPSKMWGHTPTINNFGGKTIARVTGCGFCKESTILSDVLCFMFPMGSKEFNAIRALGGCGVNSVITALALHNITLEEISKTVNIYRVTRKESLCT
jgi:hypothetical protein